MKKVALLLAFVFLLISCPAYASDTYENQILFNGITWGCTLDEFVVRYNNIELYDPDDFSFWCPMVDHLYQTAQLSDYYVKGEVGFNVDPKKRAREEMTVAGYDVYYATFWFVYTADDSGALVKDTAHSAFYSAEYELEPADPSFAYEDLTNKLCSLYGDVDYTRHENGIISYTQRVWYGADGTMVSLTLEEYNSGSVYIHIGYGAEGNFQYVLDALEAAKVAERSSVGSSTSGL